jgi:tRNA modification GTPase
VTPYAGTTRDYLRERLKIKDSVFNLVDMAGLGRAAHPVEKEGIKRGKKIAVQADGLLLVLDSSRKESPEDLELLKKFKNKKVILVFNKIDLPQKMNKQRIKALLKDLPCIDISALKGKNLEKLKQKIDDLFVPSRKNGEEVILHLRQKLLLEDILGFLKSGLRLLEEGYPEDYYAEEIRKVIPLIGELTGEIQKEEVINEIFSRFCVGK